MGFLNAIIGVRPHNDIPYTGASQPQLLAIWWKIVQKHKIGGSKVSEGKLLDYITFSACAVNFCDSFRPT